MGYAYEGMAFHLFTQSAPGLVGLYQSYSAAAVDHLPTTNMNEGAPGYSNPELLGYCSPDKPAAAPTEARRR